MRNKIISSAANYGLALIMEMHLVAGIALLLLTKTSALSLSELLSLEGVLPYLGSVIVTLACSSMGALSRLLLKRYHAR